MILALGFSMTFLVGLGPPVRKIYLEILPVRNLKNVENHRCSKFTQLHVLKIKNFQKNDGNTVVEVLKYFAQALNDYLDFLHSSSFLYSS